MSTYHLCGTLRGTRQGEAWIVDGHLTFEPPQGDAQEIKGYIYPGLVDAHTHPGVSHSPMPVSKSEVRRRLYACRKQGVTHIREMGAQTDVAPCADMGMPKVMRSGQHIARPKRYLRYLAREITPDELVAEIGRQKPRSDGWVKIVGDWIDRSAGVDADLQPLWPRNILREAVQVAHDIGLRVAVHSFATTTIDDLLEAQVDSIEHGSGMARDQMVEAHRRHILIDPTVRQMRTFPQIAAQAGKYPVYRDHMLRMDTQCRERLEMMVDVGSYFLMGSDTSADVDSNGLATEICCAVAWGMPPSIAMASASYRGRQLLGLPAWEEGAPADFVVYARDPECDIEAVRRPQHVFIDGIDTLR